MRLSNHVYCVPVQPQITEPDHAKVQEVFKVGDWGVGVLHGIGGQCGYKIQGKYRLITT